MVLQAYKRISTAFAINKQKYIGMGIASPQALYLVVNQQRNDAAAGMAHLGGALGGLIAGAIMGLTPKTQDSLKYCEVKYLDTSIRRHPDWPYSQSPRHEIRRVIVVPREMVSLITHRSWTNFLTFDFDSTKIKMEYLLFRGASIRDYLLATGWPLQWCGEMLPVQQPLKF